MAIHKPRSGSLAYYPRKRAARETPSFTTFLVVKEGQVKPLNFLCYKAGMMHGTAKNVAQGTTTYNQDVFVPVTVLECPPLKVFGARAYLNGGAYGSKVFGDVLAEKIDKRLLRRIKNFKKKTPKKKKETNSSETKSDFGVFEKQLEKISDFRLLAHTQPNLTGIGKKKPAVCEISLNGKLEEKLKFAKEKLGKEISIKDFAAEQQFLDVKAVDKGKGFTGPVKRFGIKIHGRKAKKHRVVGSIGPWHPATIMWTVARAGQHGYQTRTEYNRRILVMDSNVGEINPAAGFKNYGVVKNDFIVVTGSVPGPAKRAVALRAAIRTTDEKRFKVAELKLIFKKAAKKREEKAEKVAEKKVEKPKEKKAVKDDEKKAKKPEKKKKKVKGKKQDKAKGKKGAKKKK